MSILKMKEANTTIINDCAKMKGPDECPVSADDTPEIVRLPRNHFKIHRANQVASLGVPECLIKF